jgi:hypothetical protein
MPPVACPRVRSLWFAKIKSVAKNIVADVPLFDSAPRMRPVFNFTLQTETISLSPGRSFPNDETFWLLQKAC